MTQAFPLQWPAARPRVTDRRRAQFNKKVQGRHSYKETKELTVADAIDRLQNELDRLGAEDYILSTNLETKLNGLPRSGQAEPGDPGAALYFSLDGKPHCLPCDTYDRVADNIAAIGKHIEATRAIERYGVASLAEMFTEFQALPAPGRQAARPWRAVFGMPSDWSPTTTEVTARYRELAKERQHDHDRLTELNLAREAANKEIAP